MTITIHIITTIIAVLVQGTFAMVVTRNGNTDGYCIGTGDPYRTTVPSPFSPFNNPRGRNPFSQFFQQQGQ